MRCPNCDGYIEFDEVSGDAPFECEHCGVVVRQVRGGPDDGEEPGLEVVDEELEGLETDYDEEDYEEVAESEYDDYDEGFEEDEDDFDDNYNDEEYDPYY